MIENNYFITFLSSCIKILRHLRFKKKVHQRAPKTFPMGRVDLDNLMQTM